MSLSSTWILDRLKRLWISKIPLREFTHDGSRASLVIDWQEDQILSSSLDGSPVGGLLAALNGSLLKANPALCKILGYSSEEILKLGLQGITHPEDLQKPSYFNQLLAGTISPTQVEKRYIHRSGQVIWALSSVSVIQNNFGQPQYFLIQVQDITEYKQVENALLKSQSLLQGIVHATPDVVFIKDALGRYVIINNAGLRLLGKSADDIIGKNNTSIYSASEAERIAQIDFQVMRDGETKSYETTVTLDGAARAFLFTETPYYGTSGEALGLVVVARDITEHQQAAERLENSRAELRALSAQLQSVREEERLHIAREIHDELGQVLTGLKIDVVSLTKRLSEASVQPNWEQFERADAINR